MDVSKFKDGIDPKLVMKMLTWLTDGYAKQLSNIAEPDIDGMCNELFECMDLLKSNFYKEGYL